MWTTTLFPDYAKSEISRVPLLDTEARKSPRSGPETWIAFHRGVEIRAIRAGNVWRTAVGGSTRFTAYNPFATVSDAMDDNRARVEGKIVEFWNGKPVQHVPLTDFGQRMTGDQHAAWLADRAIEISRSEQVAA